MTWKKAFVLGLIITFFVPVLPQVVLAQPLDFVSTDNAFGYTVDTGLVYADYWQDISDGSGSFVNFPVNNVDSLDDEFSTPISIGFDFPFFENTYSQLVVSTNGYLTFENYLTEFYSYNTPFPADFAPNDIIAPFWDDLFVNKSSLDSSKWSIYYRLETDQIRIQWEEVVVAGEDDVNNVNSFQVILKNNGNIIFVYENLLGVLNQSTVGIEDVDGIDGVEVYYNEDGLVSNSAIGFTHPGAGVHLKMKPLYQGGFLEWDQVFFDLTLTNTGTVDSRFNLSDNITAGEDWDVQFLNENSNPFTDTNNDSVIDTGIVVSGAEIKIKVKVSAPSSAAVGQYSTITIRALSTVDNSKSFEVSLQVSKSAPFLLGINDNMIGVVSQVTTPNQQFDQSVNPLFTGATLSLAAVDEQRYLFAWENLGEFAAYKTIQFALFNSTSSSNPTILEVDDTSDDANVVWDSSPAISAKFGSQIAIVYVRDTYSPGYAKLDSDVYYVWLTQNGNLLDSPINISENSDVKVSMEAPSVGVNQNLHAFLAWGKRNKISDNEVYLDIMLAVYDQNGDIVSSAIQLTDSFGSGESYYTPMVTALSSGDFLLTYYAVYLEYDPETGKDVEVSEIRYMIFDQNGNVVPDTSGIITNSNGRGQDVVQLTNGNILIAWTNIDSNRIAYALLDNGGSVVKASSDLDSPDDRQMGLVSVTYDELGHGIFTWSDEEWSDYLYYALVDGSGDLISPPMRFRKGLNQIDPNIFSSFTGQGNAPIIGDLLWPVYLPLLTR